VGCAGAEVRGRIDRKISPLYDGVFDIRNSSWLKKVPIQTIRARRFGVDDDLFGTETASPLGSSGS